MGLPQGAVARGAAGMQPPAASIGGGVQGSDRHRGYATGSSAERRHVSKRLT